MGLFLVCCLGGCVLCFWLICRLKAQTSRDKKIILQAMIALESGRSAQTWLATLEKKERLFNVASESITHDSSGKTPPHTPLRFTVPSGPGTGRKFWRKF